MKTRDYVLGGKNPPREKIKPPKPKYHDKITPDGHPDEIPDMDFIPMHRKLGDPFTFTLDGVEIVGSVQRSWGPLTLISGSDGNVYLEDARKPAAQQIRELRDDERCVHCGLHFCSPECPNYHNAPEYKMSKTKTLTIGEVLAIEPGDKKNAVWINDEFEAVVSEVREPSGDKGPWKAKLSQASDPKIKIWACFWGVDATEYDGKLVRFGGKGIKRSEFKPKQGPTMQQVELGEKADLEVIGESSDSERPLPHSKTATPDNGRDASERPRIAANGHLVTARKAIFEKFRLLGLVNKAYSAMKEEYHLPDMSGGELSTFSTGVGISLSRGESLPEHVFADVKESSGMSQKELDAAPEQEWEAPANRSQSTERTSSWKEFVWKDGKKLGDAEESKLLSRSRWAFCLEEAPEDKDGKLSYANIKLLMAEKGWSDPLKLLVNSILSDHRYTEEYSDEDVNGYFQAEAGKVLDDLDTDEAAGFIGDFDNVIEGIIEFSKKPKKAAKKAKASMPD